MNRATIGLCLVVVGSAIVFLSDLLIRPANIPGTDPHAYDVVATIIVVLGVFMCLFAPDGADVAQIKADRTTDTEES